MLGGIDPIPIEAKLAHPVGEPFDDVIARRAGVTGTPKEIVQLAHFLVSSPLATPLLQQCRRQFDGRVAIGPDIGEMRHQVAVHRGGVALVGTARAGTDPILGPGRILRGLRPGVIDDCIHEHADAVPVRGIHHCAEVVLGAERWVHGRPIASPIAMVAVGLPLPLVQTSVDLLHEGRHPDGVHAEAVEVTLLDLPTHTGEIATFEAAQQRSVLSSAQCAIVGGIAVLEAIDQQEVDGRAVPKY